MEPDMDTSNSLAELFKVLTHPTRLAILQILRSGEQCVCHIEATLGMSQAYISQHLAVLRQAGLVESRRDGWNVYYQIARPEVFSVLNAASSLLARYEPVAPAVGSELKPAACGCPKCQGQFRTEPTLALAAKSE
jgi:DNA-binding transcriptional ArsR family regulator